MKAPAVVAPEERGAVEVGSCLTLGVSLWKAKYLLLGYWSRIPSRRSAQDGPVLSQADLLERR